MPKFKVVVTDYVFENFEQEEAVFAPLDVDLVIRQAKDAAELMDDVADADAILNCYLPGMNRELLQHGKKLKVVVRYGIGVDTINIPDCTELGIMVANVDDYCINEVADHAMALFLTLARKIASSGRRTRAGEWSLAYVKPLPAIREMTAGIIGFGRIGQAIAERLAPFGVKIIFADPGVDDGAGLAAKVEFDELLAQSDVIFVQCPSNEHTKRLINDESISQMTKAPLIINAARGAIVDTDALVRALASGKISGAGLDVLEDEKGVMADENHPLRTMGNVVLTPHSAWVSNKALPELQRRAALQAAMVLRGERPTKLLNPEVLKSFGRKREMVNEDCEDRGRRRSKVCNSRG